MPITQFRDLVAIQIDAAFPVIKQDEIVPSAIHFCEAQHDSDCSGSYIGCHVQWVPARYHCRSSSCAKRSAVQASRGVTVRSATGWEALAPGPKGFGGPLQPRLRSECSGRLLDGISVFTYPPCKNSAP